LTILVKCQGIRREARFVLVSTALQQEIRVSGVVNIEIRFLASFQWIAVSFL